MQEASTLSIWTLRLLRTLSIVLILLLLLDLTFEFRKIREEKPVFIVLTDRSLSMLNFQDSSEVPALVNQFKEDLKSKFSNEFTYVFKSVGNDYMDDQGYFNASQTNLYQGFDEILNQYANANIGGIALISDGNYNSGENPIYACDKLAFSPIYTLAVGDTLTKIDQSVKNIACNTVVLLNNTFKMQVDIHAAGLLNRQSNLIIDCDGKEILTKQINYTSNEKNLQTIEFNLEAKNLGYHKYTARLTALNNEYSISNNTKSVYVEVIDSKNKIGIYSRTPNPDIGAIKAALEANENFTVISGTTNFWKENPNEFNMLIVRNPNDLSKEDIEALRVRNIPILFLITTTTNQLGLNRIGTQWNLLGNQIEFNQGSYNTSFTNFQLSDMLTKQIADYPPLRCRLSEIPNKSTMDILLFQKIGPIVKTEPLVFFKKVNQIIHGFIQGEDLWRWRLHDFKNNGNHDGFNELLHKLCNFLMVDKKNTGLSISLPKKFNAREDILINANFYNESIEAITSPKITFELTNEKNEKLTFDFNTNNSSYNLNVGQVPAGQYNWIAKTKYGGNEYVKKGVFVVEQMEWEKMEFTANHDLLKTISKESSGSFNYLKDYPNTLSKIEEDGGTTITTFEEKEYKDWIEYIWFLLAIVTLLSLEWILRRRLGNT